jgi:hypothetical protein
METEQIIHSPVAVAGVAMAAQWVPAYARAAVFFPSLRRDPGGEPPKTGVRSTLTCQRSGLAVRGATPLADRLEMSARASLLSACLDNLMRYLLTGCRQHAERALLLLERAQALEGTDASFQDLCQRMGERLRASGFDSAAAGDPTVLEVRNV